MYTNKKIITRDIRIDALRALAILLILLAHSNVKGVIFNIRTFDVPLMAFLLGMSFTYNNLNESYIQYVIKRSKRLLIPTWKFLAIIFIIFYIIAYIFSINYPFSNHYIFNSLMMNTSYGYGWVMKVFFIVSILNPIILKLSNKFTRFQSSIIVFLTILFVQQILITCTKYLPDAWSYYYEQIVTIPFGYFTMAYLGMVLIHIENKKLIKWICILFLLTVGSFFLYGFHGLNTFKYPPQSPYICYGLLCSIVLLFMTNIGGVQVMIKKYSPKISWLSKHSQDIYFIHAFYIFLYEFLIKKLFFQIDHWFLFYTYLLGSSIITIIIYQWIIKRMASIQ
ncbi:hypothetical protein CON22_27990 [Bacillus cereus]|nr:hypothetical protein CON22_27990 [Bacillus cereus]